MDCMRKTWLRAVVVVTGVILSGCAGMGGPTASGPAPATGASARANAAADTATYKAITYANVATKGPAIIVLPDVAPPKMGAPDNSFIADLV